MGIRIRVMPEPNSIGARRVRQQKKAARRRKIQARRARRAHRQQQLLLQRQQLYLRQLLGLQAPHGLFGSPYAPQSIFGHMPGAGSLLAPYYGASPYAHGFNPRPVPSQHGAFFPQQPAVRAFPSSPFGAFAGLLGFG